ncbi:RHS repeat-associated core domain-containing protein [Pseudomonas putida]|uniref:RHS repeat-associated core domain-containing protein n=1 Tax=Pseudomonas putida TaxID=303 RepID=UPI003D975D31
MPRQSLNLLCRYRYDPLDRLVASTPSAQASAQRFYLKDRLATEIQGTLQHSIMQHDDQLLAQQQRQCGAAVDTALLATDQQRSVLPLLDAKQPHAFAYTPYGHCLAGGGLLSLLGFNGERPDPATEWYLLGNGYRPFNPVLMCFTSPDSWSPFGTGGLNAYCYCEGDPRNRSDSTGHALLSSLTSSLSSFIEKLKFKKSSPLMKKSKGSASKEFLVGKYKKTESYTPREGLPAPKLNQVRHRNTTAIETEVQAMEPTGQLSTQLNKLLNRYDPLKNATPDDPLRKVIATVDKTLLEEQLNINKSIFKNPQTVMQSIRSHRM